MITLQCRCGMEHRWRKRKVPTIEVSEKAYEFLKAEAERNKLLMGKSPGEWFLVDLNEIADTILRRELDPNLRDDDASPL
ncbi:MAG: hypothetical protein BGO80_00110 [Devosia sp. 63-57]|nr:MAG: hypothetical protein ABS74_11490 [Pelagibacterium sp. SCN 63-126]OJX44044.1 MAG: hypothetical protein BGO80_00110 [Devosia sp. 63-57]